jgi:hypothetical protein
MFLIVLVFTQFLSVFCFLQYLIQYHNPYIFKRATDENDDDDYNDGVFVILEVLENFLCNNMLTF